MSKRFLEESVLFVSILKWSLLAALVGIVVGCSTAIFLKLLDLSISVTATFKYYFLFLPLALFLSTLLVQYLAPEAKGHGTEKVIEAIHKRFGKIKPVVVPVKLVATIITLAMGGSAGKEGPCAQIGAGLSSIIASILKFGNKDRRKLVICGISSGFAAVFGTPIAGAMFGLEVLFVGGVLYDVLLPSFIAGIVSYQVTTYLGISYFHEPLRFVPVFSGFFFIKVCLSGLFFGFCSFLFIEVLRYFEQISRRIRIWQPLKGLIGGAALVLLSLVFSTKYLGLGLETIKTSLEGNFIERGAFLLKMLFTSITLGFGGSGGIVTPIFFIGAASGNFFANILGLDPAIFSAIGLVSLLAGAANTPIAASILAIELFGASVAPYSAVSCVISFLMTGHRSVYPSQILAVSKSPSIKVQRFKELDESENISIRPRPKSIVGFLVKMMEKIRKK
ncbi:MAG TPA: chloride channel protein [Syntrophorhabdaceae bacterium]|nr:chloride channel protein [Syntrophorhabdaceae bacterium]